MGPFNSPEVLVPLFVIPVVIIALAKAIAKYRASYKAKHSVDAQAVESTKPTN